MCQQYSIEASLLPSLTFRTGTDIIKFLLSSEVKHIRFSNILRLSASLSSGSLEVERKVDALTEMAELTEREIMVPNTPQI